MRLGRKADQPLLFETQAVILWATGDVPKPVIQLVEAGQRVYVSIVSAWEFLLKNSRHGFGLDYDQFMEVIRALEAELLPLRAQHLDTLRVLTNVRDHNDPFDRLLISQALCENFVLVGGDKQFPLYQRVHALKLLWD